MAFSLAIIILLGLIFNKLFEKMNLPGLLGMLLVGILIGPYVFNILDESILLISSDLRKIALIVILIRAGLGIKMESLKKVGTTAIKMSIIPVIIEGITIMYVSSKIFGLSYIEGGILGFIIAAVSPAVIVPSMLNFIENGKGKEKAIPTLILASASIDDIIAITLFSTFIGFYTANGVSFTKNIINIPISIFLGIAVGVVLGLLMIKFFKAMHIRDTKKTLIILGVAILLTVLEDYIKDYVAFASLLSIMTIGFVILEKYPILAKRLSSKYNKIWVLAQFILFVLVGAEVNINVALKSGLKGLIIIFIGLIGRSIGVIISLYKTDLNLKERLFCIISYIPKATVQAAIGAVPLSLGVKSGELILAVAVLSIIVTAPLGSFGIKYTGSRWLE